MTVDTYWRRADADAVRGLDPPKLRELVPFWTDDRFQQEVKARTMVLAEDTGMLICMLLRLGADNDPDDYAAWLAVEGADGVEDDDIGILKPEEGRRGGRVPLPRRPGGLDAAVPADTRHRSSNKLPAAPR